MPQKFRDAPMGEVVIRRYEDGIVKVIHVKKSQLVGKIEPYYGISGPSLSVMRGSAKPNSSLSCEFVPTPFEDMDSRAYNIAKEIASRYVH